jgi:hypothetical protein
VTVVRGESGPDVVLTGGVNEGTGLNPDTPFLLETPLTGQISGAVSTVSPPFSGYKDDLFYGPDTHAFNPSSIPSGAVRAVGSYETSSNTGVVNQGMVDVGPVAGSGGRWSTIDVPADGKNVVGHTKVCRISGSNYMTTRRWTLLKLGGSTSDGTTLYGIWQDGGDRSPNYTVAGGTSVRQHPKVLQRAFLMNYNERTGAFGARSYFSYRNEPTLLTHFEGITGVPGGFNVVAQTANDQAGMGFIAVTVGARSGRLAGFRSASRPARCARVAAAS